MKLKDVLKGRIPDKLLEYVPSSFEIIGSREKAIAIVEIDEKLEKYKKIIAHAIMEVHKNVVTVLRKISERCGEFRIRKYEILIGNETEVIHKEYGYKLLVDVTKVYFSAREATERQRIASLVKPREKILIMFSGIAPFAIAIAKKQPLVSKIICIEKNPDAHYYATKNVKINKVEDKVSCILGDVREICPKLKEKFDRILMPLPKGAYKYLELIPPLFKKEGFLHFYYWGKEPLKEIYEKGFQLVRKTFEKFDREVKLIKSKKVLPYAPRVWKVALDILVL